MSKETAVSASSVSTPPTYFGVQDGRLLFINCWRPTFFLHLQGQYHITSICNIGKVHEDSWTVFL